MSLTDVIAQIDAEIAKLQQAKVLLSGSTPVKSNRGRPKGSKNASKVVVPPKAKRRLSPEGRKAIADAMKKRWAEKSETASKTAAK